MKESKMDKELTKKKISEKNKAKKNYLEKLELLKQSYGVEFKIENFKNNDINKIKFYNMNYQKSIKNVSIIYDNKIGKYNYLSYDYDMEKYVKTTPNFKVIEDINKDKKLDLVVNEILRINKEYQLEIQDIDRRYNENNELIEDNSKELEIEKKDKKE